MDRERFFSWPCVLIFLLPFCQIGNLEAGPIVSLLHGNAPGEGFVLIDDGSSRGLLCAESWNLQSAEVACRMLGFIGIESFTQRVVSSVPFDPISVQVLRDGYICNGREQTLSECTSVTNNPSCTLAAGVVCTNNIVRLSGSSLRQYGHVEMYTNTTGWGSVCAQDWDDQDGRVICRMLGYPGMSRSYSLGVSTSDITPITIGGLTCVGSEASIEECMYDAGQNIACGIDKVALLRCQNAVRLVGVQCDSEGRVEVYHQHGSWEPICDDNFTVADATIVCQMLGLQLVEILNWDVPPSAVSSYSASLKNPWCSGNETDIRYCMHEPNAICNKYAAVKCSDPLNLCAGPFGSYSDYYYSSIYETTTREPMQKISTQTMTASTVSRRPLTTATTRTVRQTSTQNPTTVRETTASNPTTVRLTTTSNPTTVTQVTTLTPTTVRQTTSLNPTTFRETTTSNPTTVRETTTSNPTTVKETTTSNPTTVRETTTSNPTTVNEMTTSNPTTVRETTASNPTTVRQTTTSKPTTIRQTTATNPTTVRETTTSNPITVSQTSISASTHTTTLSPIKGAIDAILNETITVDNLDIVSVELANVTEDSNKFDVEDLQSVTDKLSSIIEFASDQNLTEEAIVQVSESVIGAVDNILNIPESTFETASSQQVSQTNNILTTISTLTENIQKASTNNFTYSGSNIVLAAVKVDRRKFPLTTAIGGAMDDVIDFSANEGSPSNAAGVTSVSLPEAILPSASSTNQVISVSVFLLNSPKLFQSNRSSSSSTPSSGDKPNQQPKTVSVVASPILTVTVEGIDIKDLPDNESIVFVFPVNQTLIREENEAEVSQRCVYWDIDLGEWSDEGCRTEKAALEGMVSCRCSHLTSFAVLLDIKGSIISKALDLISRIGCIASIVCLVITLCVLLGFRKLRRKQPQKILINLSFALLALYVTFVIGIDRPTWRISCTVVAILLHYFCLASLAWMGVEAFNMYMMFVRVLNSYIPKFLLKCSMIGWGIPLVIVIITVSSKWTAYQNYEYCFILPGYSLYFGLILPIGLILSFNGIIFAMVLYKLSCGRISTSKSSTLESKKENIVKARMEAIRRAQNAVAIGTLMGLTWAFGFLSFGGGRYLFNILFTIFNSLQGVFVFLLFGIRQPELKEKLKITKERFLHGASSARRRSSEFWTSSSGARMTQRPSDVTFISMVKTDSVVEGQASTYFESTVDTGPTLNKVSKDTFL